MKVSNDLKHYIGANIYLAQKHNIYSRSAILFSPDIYLYNVISLWNTTALHTVM